MFQKVDQARFLEGEHEILRFWRKQQVFKKLLAKNAGKPKWSFLDGPITANNPMGVHHAWGRTYKDAYQRYYAMTGHELRYQNGFDCQGLWVEVEVEKQLNLGTKKAIEEFGIDTFTRECKRRVLKFAARQTEQSIRLGYWMEWDDPDELRKLAEAIGTEQKVKLKTPKGEAEPDLAEALTARLGNPEWGGSYFTFSTENNETIWAFLKKCFERRKIYRGHDVMPWSGRGGSAYSQMEVADGRKLTTHKSCFVRFPIIEQASREASAPGGSASPLNEYLLVWTTTPWTLTSNVAAAVNPDLDYVKIQAKKDGAIYYFAKENLNYKRLEKEFKEGFGRPEWQWPKEVGKLKSIAQIFKEQGGYEELGTVKGADMVGWRYAGPFDDLEAQCEAFTPPALQNPQGDPTTNELAGQTSVPFRFRPNLPYGGVRELSGMIAWLTGNGVFRSSAIYAALHSPDIYRQISGLPAPSRTGLASECSHHFSVYVANALLSCSASGVVGEDDTTDLTASLEKDHGEFGPLRSLSRLGFPIHAEQWTPIMACSRVFCARLELRSELRGKVDDGERDRLVEAQAPGRGGVTLDDAFFDNLCQKTAELVASIIRFLEANVRDKAPHRVIDGGRDSKGNANVVAGEGTGIVHIAPGCGDIDHKIGVELGLPIIAPLKEDGTYGEGFGDFTGREAIAPETADLVFEELKRKGYLVYVETYPHIYPHCWRTGDELVFRLVDEWFINMDWRDEIKEVTKAINWLPESIQGQEREIEWLTTMRDWMISKKRFWGLALPIWVDPDDPSDFEVIGSLAELQERATNGGEGWEQFESAGHTPHRPWIDRVKIRSKKTDKLLSRVEDVGNPWLDAGIVPFSTLGYNAWKKGEASGFGLQDSGGNAHAPGGSLSTLNPQPSTLNWPDWFPADFVTECFPGQFRNWFYSLLSLATMMRYDETDDPALKRPFKNLLGHRLVMDENGKAMHKSDGTAIWFEEAAEQLGVDTLRWMYLAQNPAVDLRFGTRHKDEPVELQTVDGPISQTKEGLPTCKVTSKPADEIRRQVLIPLWNSYAFFVNYAVLDQFDPSLEQVAVQDRPEIDRWILSRLQELIGTAHTSFQAYRVADFMAGAATFIDDLSNWYIRRNRRRFWRARGDQETQATPWDKDKLAAYQTLYEVLLTLSKLLAPCVPFLAERMYLNLIEGRKKRDNEGESVHLCDYPQVDADKLDAELNWKTQQVQTLVRVAHRLRETQELRVRQPLSELRFACLDSRQAAALEQYAEIIADELNVKQVVRVDNLDALVSYSYKPNLKTLGPKYGKLLNAIRTALESIDSGTMTPLRQGNPVTLSIGGESVTLEPADVMVGVQQASDWAGADDAGIQVALSTALTKDLILEGMARDLIRHVQQLRKDADLEENRKITVTWTAAQPDEPQGAIDAWRETILAETRGDSITRVDTLPVESKPVSVGESEIRIWIDTAG